MPKLVETQLLIVTASDDTYSGGVITLIGSLALHNPGARITVLDRDISDRRRAEIDALGARFDVNVTRRQVDASTLAHLPLRTSHLNSSTYLRLLIPSLFPDESRVLYLDSDMLVLGSLAELARVDLGSDLIAAVPDAAQPQAELDSTGLEHGQYINAGLLLMNLAAWRRENTAQACFDILSDRRREILYEDQSAINIACKGRIRFLPFRYNSSAWLWSHRSLDGSLPTDPAILHYLGPVKPWAAAADLGAVWRAYAETIDPGLLGFVPPPEGAARIPLSKRLNRLNRRRKLLLSWLLRDRAYQMRVRAAETVKIAHEIERNCLARHRNVTEGDELARRASV